MNEQEGYRMGTQGFSDKDRTEMICWAILLAIIALWVFMYVKIGNEELDINKKKLEVQKQKMVIELAILGKIK